MAMMNAVLRQAVPASGVSVHLPTHHSVSRIPIEREVRRLNGGENLCSFAAGRRITGAFVFDHQQKPLLPYNLSGRAQLLVHGCAVGSYILEPPKVEAANL